MDAKKLPFHIDQNGLCVDRGVIITKLQTYIHIYFSLYNKIEI